MNREAEAKLVRLVTAAGIGAVTVELTWLFGVPGKGEFLVVAAVAGLAVALLAPGPAGYLVLLASIAVMALVHVLIGAYGGLIALVIGAMWLPATAGWLVGFAAMRVRHLGLGAALADRRTLGALLGAVLSVAAIASFAMSFATNPP